MTLPEPADRRPQVAAHTGQRGVWLFASAALLGAVGLFAVLESRRTQHQDGFPPTQGDSAAMISAPPPLAIPSPPPEVAPAPIWPTPTPAAPMADYGARVMAGPRAPAPVAIRLPDSEEAFASRRPVGHIPPPIAPTITRPKMVDGAPSAENQGNERVEAARLANPSTTVPKGTLIQAVLETALDSTRSGLARSLVSRDVPSFDGSRILIPRGSRLTGEYKSDLAQGQNRALVIWQRLVRPDGVTINLESPAADPLGRTGIKGKVNGHFVQQFGGALLQSALNVGSQVAVNELTAGMGTTVVSIPSGTQSSGTSLTQNKITPTLTVRQGTSVSVFVARDLDFTQVERGAP